MPKITLNISWEQVDAGNVPRITNLFSPPIDDILLKVHGQVVFSIPPISTQEDVERFSSFSFVVADWIFLPWVISLENSAYLTILKCSAISYRFVQYPTHAIHLPDADEWEDLVEDQIDMLSDRARRSDWPRILVKARKARLLEYSSRSNSPYPFQVLIAITSAC